MSVTSFEGVITTEKDEKGCLQLLLLLFLLPLVHFDMLCIFFGGYIQTKSKAKETAMSDNYKNSRKGSYGGYKSRRSSGREEDSEEEEEEDVWEVASEREDSSSPKMRKSSNNKKDKHLSASSSSPCAWKSSASSTPRMTIAPPARIEAKSSAPLNIPDWSKIYGKKRNELVGSNWFHGDMATNSHDYDGVNDSCGGNDDDDEEEEEEEEDTMPPHEWLAKKLARSQISTFSVYEGIGRTLKGRDLSKVRNSVLTKTGFLE